MEKSYGELVAQATSAVAGVKDAELRRVAFERILDDLLSRGARPRGEEGPSASGRRAKRKANADGARPKKSGPLAYVEEMAAEKFFVKPKTIAEVKAELENRGHHIPLTSLSGPLQRLCQRKKLRRQKVKGKGKKETFAYSDW